MDTIVIGYDDTPAARRALERAATLAKALGSKLVVTSVAPVVASAARSAGPIDPTDTPADHVAELKHAREYLSEQGLDAEYVPAVGHPADTIAEVAREQRADLVVVGTRELGHIQRLLGQSVSEAVAHKVECDLLIVH